MREGRKERKIKILVTVKKEARHYLAYIGLAK